MNNFTPADDKRFCEWWGIEPSRRIVHGTTKKITGVSFTFPAVLSNPTPDTEAMVRDAMCRKGYQIMVLHMITGSTNCTVISTTNNENARIASGPAIGVIALAGWELVKNQAEGGGDHE